MKAKSSQKISVIQRKLWEECKRLTRAKYGYVCYTCSKNLENGVQNHTGHFIPKSVSGAYLKYDLRNLRPQCYNCNINLGGNGAEFYRRLVENEGQGYVDELFRDKQKTVKALDHYLFLLDKYKSMD